jgi:hypothetical protein
VFGGEEADVLVLAYCSEGLRSWVGADLTRAVLVASDQDLSDVFVYFHVYDHVVLKAYDYVLAMSCEGLSFQL